MARIWPAFGLRADTRRPVVPVLSETVLILRLALPLLAPGQRKSAALYAAEPFLAQPLEDMRVILGPRLEKDDPAIYLAVALARDTLDRILAQNRDSRARFVPDVLLLPRPDGDQWVVAERGGRILARLPDGTGFAASDAGFRAIWSQAGRPPIAWHHGTPPTGLPLASQSALTLPLLPEPALAAFDLAEGRVPDWRQPRRLRALVAVLAVGFCVHLGLLALDIQRLRSAADAREVQLRQALTDRGIPIGTSVDAAVADALRGGQADQSPGFLPMLGNVLQAMTEQSGIVTLQDIAYDNGQGQLILTLIAPDLGPLQDTAALLLEAGMVADLGTSTISDGQARATVAIKQGVEG